MLRVDTNVLVRAFVEDGSAQAVRARAILAEDQVYIAKTVLLETEWVLRTRYRYRPHEVVSAFKTLANARQVQLEDPTAVMSALALADQGLDFADALHLSSGKDGAFVTFDRDLLRAAERLGFAVREP
jgi:predicted nucleic-acid-binding protein